MENGVTVEKIKECIQKSGGQRENILEILLTLQGASNKGYIDQETAQIVAQELKMTETRVYEIIRYYAMLQDKPQAKYVLEICNSSPCRFSKSEQIAELLAQKFGVKIGETTKDGIFTFHYTPCVGACDIGPVIKIKDTVVGNLTEEKVEKLLDDLRLGKINC